MKVIFVLAAAGIALTAGCASHASDTATTAPSITFQSGMTPGMSGKAMPGMSGPELHQELLSRGHQIPVVFITAHRDETVRPRLLAQGAVDCLFKPFSDTALRQALDAALLGKD